MVVTPASSYRRLAGVFLGRAVLANQSPSVHPARPREVEREPETRWGGGEVGVAPRSGPASAPPQSSRLLVLILRWVPAGVFQRCAGIERPAPATCRLPPAWSSWSAWGARRSSTTSCASRWGAGRRWYPRWTRWVEHPCIPAGAGRLRALPRPRAWPAGPTIEGEGRGERVPNASGVADPHPFWRPHPPSLVPLSLPQIPRSWPTSLRRASSSRPHPPSGDGLDA